MVTKAIKYYLDNHIRLSQKDISEAVKSRDWFLKRIENVINSRGNEPKLYSGKHGDKFLYFGSYFKGTKVSDVDEFDVLVLIDSNSGIYSKSGVQVGTGQGVVQPNPKYFKKYFKEDDSGISPSKMLNWLKGVVEEVIEPYDGEAPDRDGQAITATIKSKGLKIDLVPAGVFEDKNGNVFFNIPDGTVSNSWITTSPRLDIEMLDKLAENRNHFKNVIRILKRIKDTHNFQMPSFPIEMSAVHYVHQNTWHDNLYADTALLIDHLSQAFKVGHISDQYNNGQNLLSGVDNLGWYSERLDKIFQGLVNCNKLDNEELVRERVINLFENK